MASTIKAVIVVGGSGSVGPSIITALLEAKAKFDVSVLTRESSTATFPQNVKIHRTSYTEASLLSAFKGQHAIVSTVATFATHLQASIIDTAVKAGVKRFIPSEYGVDTSLPILPDILPFGVSKPNTVQYLKSRESLGLSWTAICVGVFFDWAFQYPGSMGWNVPERKATVFDGGDVEYEATNVAQIAIAVVASLSPEHYEETMNQYIYVNSFTLTQNRVLRALEKHTGDKFEVTHASAKELSETSLERYKAVGEFVANGRGEYADGSVDAIVAAIYGYGRLNNFSKTHGLWNKKLGLPVEEMEETVSRAFRK